MKGSLQESFDSVVDSMFAVDCILNAGISALNQAMRVHPDVHIVTVLQFRHREFGIYSKFAKNLEQMLI